MSTQSVFSSTALYANSQSGVHQNQGVPLSDEDVDAEFPALIGGSLPPANQDSGWNRAKTAMVIAGWGDKSPRTQPNSSHSSSSVDEQELPDDASEYSVEDADDFEYDDVDGSFRPPSPEDQRIERLAAEFMERYTKQAADVIISQKSKRSSLKF